MVHVVRDDGLLNGTEIGDEVERLERAELTGI